MKTTLRLLNYVWLLSVLFMGTDTIAQTSEMTIGISSAFSSPDELGETAEIIGTVTDELGPLPGANIVIKGTNNGTTSNFDGHFSLVNVQPGSHVLVISYIGYDTKEVAVEVTKREQLNLGTITLSAGSEALEEVVIKGGYKSSQQKALNIKKQSIAIMEVMASDVIGKLPDRNAAEAVQRMQGVSIERDHGEGRYVIVRGTPIAWNSTLMNGSRMPSTEGTSDNTGGTRTAPLDVFPSEMIEFVELSKAITPDMEGDAIGGSVNFITRTAPNKKTLSVNLGYGQNFQAEKPVQNASIVYGDRVADGKIGFMVSGTYWNRNWGTDNYEVVYNENFSINNLQLRDYLGKRTTAGFNAGMEYKPNDNTKIFVRGLYTDFKDEESAVEHTFAFPTQDGETLNTEGEMSLRVRHGITGITLFGTEMGGNHKFANGKFNIDWKASTYDAEMGNRKLPNSGNTGEPAYLMATFSTPVTYNNLTSDGYKFLDIDAPAGYNGDHYDNIQPYLSSTVEGGQLQLDNQLAYKSYSKETDYTGQLDFTYQPSEKVKLKAGGKYKTMKLERGAPYSYYLYLGGNYGAPIYMTDYATTGFPYNGGYLSEIGNPYDNVLLDPIKKEELPTLFNTETLANPMYYHINFNKENPSSAGAFYTGNEDVAAAYVMGDISLSDKLKLMAGARYEHTYLKYKGHAVTTTEDGPIISEIENSNDFGSLLPMVHLKYMPKDNLNLKLAYTRTFARANFSDLNPTETVSLLSIPNTISRGNIKLEPTYSNNFDFMGEYFFKDVGLVSGGVFYKSLENLIYSARSYETIDGELYQVTQPNNSEQGWLAGFELGISKRLTFLPGFLSGFGVEANYTFADSEMDVPQYDVDQSTGEIMVSTTTEKIPNQSKHIFNTALFYEKGGLTVRLAGNYKGESLAVVQGNTENYRWYDKNFTVDLSTSYRLNSKLRFYLELNNLTNEPLRYYQGTADRPEQTEYYSLRGMFGINYNIF
ncbi:TonB-dependent receptor [Mangrovimonas sp. YM274]|uniref:TonB-dependent receptor n=1 Tax=Mangrovimonas sp. YM274 TaxID=3070660 RepID=UPI0027DE78ED|nr:TonB-dependent receptor [Mangrovimonas sp. YM274]WMI68148.1 TonB-dependent receptor [Mangrovimonas sp. YM274]